MLLKNLSLKTQIKVSLRSIHAFTQAGKSHESALFGWYRGNSCLNNSEGFDQTV